MIQIENKYNVGDRVWFIGNTRRANIRKIEAINFRQEAMKMSGDRVVPKSSIEVTYEFDACMGGKKIQLRETQIFATKQELLDSL
jgi:hypothetical protein